MNFWLNYHQKCLVFQFFKEKFSEILIFVNGKRICLLLLYTKIQVYFCHFFITAILLNETWLKNRRRTENNYQIMYFGRHSKSFLRKLFVWHFKTINKMQPPSLLLATSDIWSFPSLKCLKLFLCCKKRLLKPLFDEFYVWWEPKSTFTLIEIININFQIEHVCEINLTLKWTKCL